MDKEHTINLDGNSTNLSSNSSKTPSSLILQAEEYNDDDNQIQSIEELKSELEKLKDMLKEKTADSEKCIFLRKLSILRMYNEFKYNQCSRESIMSQFNSFPSQSSFESVGAISERTEKSEKSCSISDNYFGEVIHKRNSINILKKTYALIENEDLFFQNNNTMIINCKKTYEGEVLITSFRLIFNPKNTEFFHQDFVLPEYYQIPFMFIQSVNKKKENNKFKYALKLQFRDRPPGTIYFLNKKDCETSFEILNEKMNTKNFKSLFAFEYFYKYNKDNFDQNLNGWSRFKYLVDFERMGIDLKDKNSRYKCIVQLMMDKNICDTYPFLVFTYHSLTNEDIEKVANFRSKKRFPALVWLSESNNATLWRSSQAKTGVIDKRSCYDETFFSTIASKTEKFHIYDARPYINALANKFRGMGFENIDNYKNAELIFCDIENIHAENATVLVHCSDGWDRTSQLTSLAQLIVDPYYRKLEGFIILIEKEWVSFGHQFALRCGHSYPKQDDDISPIFVQWLDTVHQLVYQTPDLFEFNNDLLLFIAYHVYSCLYGTFLFNCEKERAETQIKNNTVSIWTDVILNKNKFINEKYDECKSNRTILTPSCAFYKLRLWEEHFLRWNPYYVMNNSHKLTSPILNL